MSLIWHECEKLEQYIVDTISNTATEFCEPHMDEFNRGGWKNRVWRSDSIRRAHLDVVDARESKRMWMMHFCIMPQLHNGGPIYGLDIVAGQRKVTGFFLDASMSSCANTIEEHYHKSVEDAEWKKQRELPEWAQAIFSDHMVAAGNIQDIGELQNLVNLATNTLQFYVENIHITNHTITEQTGKTIQNTYAYHQKRNPHTPKVMKSLGLDDASVAKFCGDCLFPVLT